MISRKALLEEMENDSRNKRDIEYGDWLYLKDALAIITNAPTVHREGWVSVPIEPTAEMIESGRAQGKNNELEFRHRDDGSKLIYQAMLSAAQKE